LVLLAATTAGLVLLKNVARVFDTLPGPLLLLLLYGVVAMISSMYVPQYSLYSMWKGFEVVVDVMVIMAIISYKHAQGSVRIAYNVILVLAGALLVAYWLEAAIVPSSAFLPSRGLLPFAMQGVMPVMNGNAFGFLSAVVAFAAWCRFARRTSARSGLMWAVATVWAMGTLILAQSRTSLIGLAAAFCIYLVLERRFVSLIMLLSAIALITALTQFSEVATQYFVRGQSNQLFSSLSGRTQAWGAAFALFQQAPITGHGFAAAARLEILGPGGASNLHGAVFDVLVGVGLLGLVPWAGSIIWTLLRAVRLPFRPSANSDSRSDRMINAEIIGLFMLVLIRALTSSGLAMHDREFMFFLLVIAYVSTAASRRSGAPLRRPSESRSRQHGRRPIVLPNA
jgi:O-antigen ligase